MAFNIDFGQRNIDNSLKRRELDLRQQQIDNQREAAERSAFVSLANSSSTAGRNALMERELALKENDFAFRQEQQKKANDWNEALNAQKEEEYRLKNENLRKMSNKYDLAFQEDEVRAKELLRQANEREQMLNGELATVYLSSLRHGGNVSDSQLQIFNKSTGENFDFIGNYANIPMRDGSIVRRAIGNNNSFYMGKFDRDERGNIIYGEDGTPIVSMIEMPKQMQEMIKRSAYGKEYIDGSKSLSFDERLALQRATDNARWERQAAQNENRFAIAKLNAEQRQKAADAARVLKELGYAIDIDLAEAKAADASARSMANAKTGITNEAKYTPEQIEAEKKRAEEARKRARGKVGSRQANPSSGDNRTMPTVAKDTNSITMPDGKVVKKNETYTDSRGRTMRWVGPGPKDWKIVK
jgi:hypothetical protein